MCGKTHLNIFTYTLLYCNLFQANQSETEESVPSMDHKETSPPAGDGQIVVTSDFLLNLV